MILGSRTRSTSAPMIWSDLSNVEKLETCRSVLIEVCDRRTRLQNTTFARTLNQFYSEPETENFP